MPQAALLRHQTAPEEHHFDWLLAPDDAEHRPDDRVLRCFRVRVRIDTLEAGQAFEADRIDDHRWRYLTWEGELSGGRGTVERVNAGSWTPIENSAASIAGTMEWADGASSSFLGAPIDPDKPARWRFQIGAPERR